MINITVRRTMTSAWGLAVVGLGFGLAVALPATQAHDPKHHIVPEERVELSFGRSEDYDYDPPAPGSYRLPRVKPAADGAVLAPDGRSLRLHDLMDDHITVLAFIYTRCSDPNGCPLSMGLLYDLQYVSANDPAIGETLRLIALSFDPEHDTPAVMDALDPATQAEDGAGADLMFLTTGSEAALAPILDGYDQPIGRKTDAGDPFGPFVHQLRVYLVDREKRIRNIYSLGFLDPRLVVTDIRTLLLEDRDRGPEG